MTIDQARLLANQTERQASNKTKHEPISLKAELILFHPALRLNSRGLRIGDDDNGTYVFHCSVVRSIEVKSHSPTQNLYVQGILKTAL